MNKQEAEEYAKTMTYRDAIHNALQGKCIPYRKATLIKLNKLLDLIEPKARGWKADTIIFDEFALTFKQAESEVKHDISET